MSTFGGSFTPESGRVSSDRNPAPRWHISAFLIEDDGAGQAELVGGLRELRARILYDYGRRPDFRDPAGTHVDDQELDYGAWHFVARREPGGPPLGYVRLATPGAAAMFQSQAYLGAEEYERVLRAEGADASHTFEHSRLVVEHRARKLGLGAYLSAVAIGAAHSLGARLMIGTSGTKDGQPQFHARFGFRPVPGTRRYVAQYTEDVVVMVHRTDDGASEYTELVQQMRAEFPRFAAATPETLHQAPAPHVPAPPGLGSVCPPDQQGWQPVLFEPLRTDDRAGLIRLLESGEVRAVHDTIDEQLAELIRSREPARRFAGKELASKVAEQLAGTDAWAYGTWAWYPWSGRLVHLLPREEFRLVRTDRNREKIQRPQQRRLFGQRIGIIGLSVGNSAALTLVLEGIGGSYRLADFDELSLSNLNRLRAGIHDLGVNKAVLCARQMFEIDPYLDIEIQPAGLSDATMDEFFEAASGPLDLLVEECDTPYVKIAVREKARALGIPVVMDCNDRGMLDIERFDLEPARPLLHGRLGDTSSQDMLSLDQQAKVGLLLAMVDGERISPELAAAIPELGRTLSSWPQLASDVALGGALVAEVARRILLGRPCASGRYYIDLGELITPAHNTAAEPITVAPLESRPA